MSLLSKEDLIANLADKEFRDSLVCSRVDGGTAFQIRYLRESEGLTQAELAKRLETSQNSVWRLESPQYGKASLATLKKLAKIFDVALEVRFIRFSELVDKVLNQSTESVTVDSFKRDRGLKAKVPPAVRIIFPYQGKGATLEESMKGKPQNPALYEEQTSGGLGNEEIVSSAG